MVSNNRVTSFSQKTPTCRFKGDVKLAGVLYFHRISDIRMGGISTKNFGMFRKLFGDKVLRNVVIVTNRWGEVDPRVGERREAELAGDHLFFKPVLAKGARIARHHGTVPSAEAIIRLILENPPLPLRTQEDLMVKCIHLRQVDMMLTSLQQEDAPKRTIAFVFAVFTLVISSLTPHVLDLVLIYPQQSIDR